MKKVMREKRMGICSVCGDQFRLKVWNQKLCGKKSCLGERVKRYNKKYHDAYYVENSDYVKGKSREYRVNNPDKYNAQKRKYYSKNKDQINKYFRQYKKERFASDKQYLVGHNLSRRVYMAFKNQRESKPTKTTDLIGCSISFLMKHLESQFTEGMSWDNYGLHGWHMDHIKPCASFDLTCEKQQKECFNFTNMQPLWAEDNLKKGASLTWDRYQ